MGKRAKVPHSEPKAELDKELEAKLDRRAAKAAKELKGHVHINRPLEENVMLQVVNEVFRKTRLRKVN
jgi:hypothetical protein